MLESAVIHNGIGALEDRVVTKRSFTEHSAWSRDDFAEPFERGIPTGGSKRSRWIGREPDPFAGDLSAVDGKSSNVERHVGQIVIVRRHEIVGPGRRIHSRRNAPRWLGSH